jgi:hypothetical protein
MSDLREKIAEKIWRAGSAWQRVLPWEMVDDYQRNKYRIDSDSILSLIAGEMEKLKTSQDAHILDSLPGSYTAALNDVLALLKGEKV